MAFANGSAIGGNTFGKATASSGTVINVLVPPPQFNVFGGKAYTRVTGVGYLPGTTAHTITAARAKWRCLANGANASGQAVLNIAALPLPGISTLASAYAGATTHTPVANEWVAVRESDGVTRVYQISSYTALAITLTANLVVGTVAATSVLPASSVWFFGVLGTTADPNTGAVDQTFLTVASTQYSLPLAGTDPSGGVVASNGLDEPILLQSNNATAAGAFNQVSYGYSVS